MANRAYKKMDCGVYAITHVDSGKRYIGSSINFRQRLRVHKSYLRGGTHRNPYLQNVWNKYGENAFTFSPILVCAQNDLLFYEQLLMDGYETYHKKNGFNARERAESSYGYVMSLEDRLKRSKPSPFKGKKRPELSKPRPPFSVEHRIKLGLAAKGKIPWNKGKPHSLETRKKLSDFFTGKPTGRKINFTKELREKISKSQKKRFENPEAREKMRLAKLGKKQGPYKSGNAVKTHCPKGHTYSGDNLYMHPNANRRSCKECLKLNGIKYRKNKVLP